MTYNHGQTYIGTGTTAGTAKPGNGAADPREPLTLDPLAGPPIPPIECEPAAVIAIGRSSSCQCVLPDESISRRHASVAHRDGIWFITDLGSTHGTLVNSTRLEPQAAAPIKGGDLIAMGPWTFRVRMGPATSAVNSLLDDAGHSGRASTLSGAAARQRVERVQDRELASITQQRLNLLMECAAAVAGVEDDHALAKVIIDAAMRGTAFPRAALLRDLGNEVEVILDSDPAAPGDAPRAFSRSLIQEARKGEMVKLVVEDGGGAGASASIMILKIQTALCAPIKVGDQVSGFLYLDSRADEQAGPTAGAAGGGTVRRAGSVIGGATGGIPADASTFCQAVARMCSLAMGNMARGSLERRQAELVRDLSAAREAQQMIMPKETASVAGVRYAMKMKPGRMVAGDLFDVVPLDEHRTAIFLGDVAGKGISAAILMATAQTHLSAGLRQHKDAAMAACQTNRHICAHAASNKFISLWLGIFDARARTLSYVDAGHGYWLVAAADGSSTGHSVTSGGIPLGIDEDFAFVGETIQLPTGSRLVVFSDGVAEQPGPDGEQFSVERAVAAITNSRDVGTDAQLIYQAVLDYARTDSLADDTTVASITFE